jgi:hypothetical protein
VSSIKSRSNLANADPQFRQLEPLSRHHRTDLIQRTPRLLEHFNRCKAAPRALKRTFALSLKDYRVAGWYCLTAGIAGPHTEPFPILQVSDIAVAAEFTGTGLFEMLRKDAEQRIKALAKRRIVESLKEGLRR